MTPRAATFSVFFLNGAMIGTWVGQIPFVQERLDVSKVYYLPAGVDVANSIGRAMGGIAVSRMPTPVSITGGPARLGDATVVVMLGKDLANNKPIVPGT